MLSPWLSLPHYNAVSVSVCAVLDGLFWEIAVLYQKQAWEDEKQQEADKKT